MNEDDLKVWKNAEAEQNIEAASSWEEAFEIGKCLYALKSPEYGRLIAAAYEKAFSLGLNINSDRNCFIEATQEIAYVYLMSGRRDEAINKLLILDSNCENLPDRVNLFIASALIQTDNIRLYAADPKIFFRQLDKINETDAEALRKRSFVFLRFLNRLNKLVLNGTLNEVDTDNILKKARELGVYDSKQCTEFRQTLGL